MMKAESQSRVVMGRFVSRGLVASACVASALVLGGCGSAEPSDDGAGSGGSGAGGAGSGAASGAGGSGATGTGGTDSGSGGGTGSGGASPMSPAHQGGGPEAGNPDGNCDVPSEGQIVDTTSANVVIGDGTPASCTSAAVVSGIAQGGTIRFDCGPEPITITLEETAKIYNNTGPDTVIDGGGLVTLSGGGVRRILYMNTCDEELVYTTPHCDNQDHPRVTVQNLTFIEGNASGEGEDLLGGGGAIFARGGRMKILNSRFFNNVCAPVGQDVGGGAVRIFDQFEDAPVYLVGSTFGGEEGYGNECSNGGGISSIGVSWNVINSLFSHNAATGNGGNPAEGGTPGGGSGGAIYNDGNLMTLSLCGTRIEYNSVNAYGSAIFFVSNNHTGDMVITDSVITNNIGGSWYPAYPQISHHDDTPIVVTNSTIE